MKKLLLLTAALVAACLCARAQEVYDIENEGTRKFLEEIDYSADTAYVLSFAREYKKNFGANDKPLPVTLSWEGEAARLLMSTSPGLEAGPEVTSINQLVYNWATTRHSADVDPLSAEEIELLRKYLIVKD